MATDLTIYLSDDPGELARLGQILGRRNVNIDGLCALALGGGGQAEAHLLVDDASAAFAALGAEGVQVEAEQEVLVVSVEDRPGALGQCARLLGAAGVNLNILYLATDTRLVIGADDLARAAELLDAF